MRRVDIEWDDDSVDHIALHQVEPDEVEEVLRGRYLLERGRQGRYRILGQSDAGRYLFVVMARRRSYAYRVVTARDMTPSERKRFKRKVR
jgi:hypothetical protein